MSVRVEVEELQARIAEFGPVAFLTTVGSDSRPHVVSVKVEDFEGALVVGAGRTTAGNAETNPRVTLLWPAKGDGDYCLIVDGIGVVREAGPDLQLAITPARAVLHRLAGAAGSGPSCVSVLDEP
jgi:hypothetical protein